jgi:hypothetical protein
MDTTTTGGRALMDRRQALTTIGLGGTGFIAGSAFTAPACNGKSVSAEVTVVETFLKVVAVEIPNQKPTIDKILKVADDFNADYQWGDFASAASVFASLDADITQLISDLGVNVSDHVKADLVLIDAGLTAIWQLLNSQKTPAVQGVIAKQGRSAQAQSIESRRAGHLEKLFASIH